MKPIDQHRGQDIITLWSESVGNMFLGAMANCDLSALILKDFVNIRMQCDRY